MRSWVSTLILASGALWGQAPTGQMTGTATDPSGADVHPGQPVQSTGFLRGEVVFRHTEGIESQLCLPQISSGAGGGRRIPAANQMFGLSSPATIEKHEKPTLRIANKGVLSCREARSGTPVPGLELRRGLLRSGCSSLVAVGKSANLRYGNNGSECRRRPRPGRLVVSGPG